MNDQQLDYVPDTIVAMVEQAWREVKSGVSQWEHLTPCRRSLLARIGKTLYDAGFQAGADSVGGRHDSKIRSKSV